MLLVLLKLQGLFLLMQVCDGWDKNIFYLSNIISGVRYTDQRLTDDQFAGVKNRLPYGQLPIAKVDGEFIAQSTAIARYDTGYNKVCVESRDLRI